MPSNYSDELFKRINRMVEDLKYGATVQEKKLYEGMVKAIANANVTSPAGAAASVGKLIKGMETSLASLDSYYAKQMTAQIKELSKFQAKALKSLAYDERKTKAITQAVAGQVAKTLVEGAGTGPVKAALNKALLASTMGGASKDQIIDSLSTIIGVGDNKVGLPRTIEGLATDALNQYTATYNNTVSSDIGAEWYSYTGSIIETSRCFCKSLEDRGYFHISEVQSMLGGKYANNERMDCDEGPVDLNPTSGLPQGMYADTTAGSFFVYRGGYNCGHQILPVHELIVPEQVKDVVYASAAYKKWAAGNPERKPKVPPPEKEVPKAPRPPKNAKLDLKPWSPATRKKFEDAGFNVMSPDEELVSGSYGFDFDRVLDEVLSIKATVPGAKLFGTVQAENHGTGAEIRMNLRDEKNKAVVELVRTFRATKTKKIVEHDFFRVSDDIKKTDAGKRLMKVFYEQYKQIGIDEVRVHANINSGGYVWAKYGFEISPPSLRLFRDSINDGNVPGWHQLTNTEKDDVKKWIDNTVARLEKKGETASLHELATTTYGKRLLIDSDWNGYLDLHSEKYTDIFENYLYR